MVRTPWKISWYYYSGRVDCRVSRSAWVRVVWVGGWEVGGVALGVHLGYALEEYVRRFGLIHLQADALVDGRHRAAWAHHVGRQTVSGLGKNQRVPKRGDRIPLPSESGLTITVI